MGGVSEMVDRAAIDRHAGEWAIIRDGAVLAHGADLAALIEALGRTTTRSTVSACSFPSKDRLCSDRHPVSRCGSTPTLAGGVARPYSPVELWGRRHSMKWLGSLGSGAGNTVVPLDVAQVLGPPRWDSSLQTSQGIGGEAQMWHTRCSLAVLDPEGTSEVAAIRDPPVQIPVDPA